MLNGTFIADSTLEKPFEAEGELIWTLPQLNYSWHRIIGPNVYRYILRLAPKYEADFARLPASTHWQRRGTSHEERRTGALRGLLKDQPRALCRSGVGRLVRVF